VAGGKKQCVVEGCYDVEVSTSGTAMKFSTEDLNKTGRIAEWILSVFLLGLAIFFIYQRFAGNPNELWFFCSVTGVILFPPFQFGWTWKTIAWAIILSEMIRMK
jgi:hypothetical protein